MTSITIGYQGRNVRIDSDDGSIVAHLGRRFRMMVASSEAEPCACFTAQCSGNAYLLNPGAHSFVTKHPFLHRLEYEILNALILAHPRFIWIHAGAAAREEGAVLISGHSGCGKSTIVTGLCRRGWQYLSDDLLPIEPESRRIHPFLRSPWFRLSNDSLLPPERIIELRKSDVDLDGCIVAAAPVELAMMVFPVYRHGAPLAAARLSGAPVALELSSNITNFDAHGERGLAFLATIGRDVPAWRLEYSDRQLAIEWVDRTFQERISRSRCASALEGADRP